MGVDVRHPDVAERRFALTLDLAERQVQRGLYVVERGERYAIPVDRANEIQHFAAGRFEPIEALSFQGRELWQRDAAGRVYRPGVEFESRKGDPEREAKAWEILGYKPTMLRGNLYARHWHAGWANPFNPDKLDVPLDPSFETLLATHWPMQFAERLLAERKGILGATDRLLRHRLRQIEVKLLPAITDTHNCRLAECPATIWPRFEDALAVLCGARGFVEDLGWLCGALVTQAFVSEIVDELVSATGSEFADFDFHEVGTDNTAESNAQTALLGSSGIARATGTPTDDDPDYINVATVTADTTESWEEHGIFNNSTGPAMMDRNLTGGIAVNNSDQVEFTYTLTVNPES